MSALDLLAAVKAKRKEQDYCYAVLDLWARVQAQGIDVNSVDVFGFSEKRLSPRDQHKARLASRLLAYGGQHPFLERLPNGHTRPRVHNYVRHRDGTVTTLDPMLEAVYKD